MKYLSFILMLQFVMFSVYAQDPMRDLRRQQREQRRAERRVERQEDREERQQARFEKKKAKVLAKQEIAEAKFFENYDRDFRKVKREVKKGVEKLSNDELVIYAKLLVEELKRMGKLEEALLLSKIENDPAEIRSELEKFMSEEKEQELRTLIKADIKKVGGFYNYMFITQRKVRAGCMIGTGAAIAVVGAVGIAGAGSLFFLGLGGAAAALTSGATFGTILLYPITALAGAIVGGIPLLAGYGAATKAQAGVCRWDYREYTTSTAR